MNWNGWICATPELGSLFGGLKPRASVSVGEGFSREDLKADLLARVDGFTADAFTTPGELALRIAGSSLSIATSSARREALRRLWGTPAILSRLDALKRLRLKPQGLILLDRALQAGRLAFSHPTEEDALEASLGLDAEHPRRLLRQELRFMAQAYEAVLESCGWCDLPRALELGIRALENPLLLPERLPSLVVDCDQRHEREPRERLFWELVASRTSVARVGGEPSSPAGTPRSAVLEQWHTVDDAAEALADCLAESASWNDIAVLIPPAPHDTSIRRSLTRALRAREIPLDDPRDPDQVKLAEPIKRALLPWELVARDFKRELVWEWARAFVPAESARWHAAISERGIVRGLESYAGGKLEGLHARLKALSLRLSGKHRLTHWAELHLQEASHLPPEWQRFFAQFWQAWIDESRAFGDGDRRLRAAYVYSRLIERLRETPAPIPALRARAGVRVYRVTQTPPRAQEAQVFALGIPAEFLKARAAQAGTDDLWWSAAERERLSEYGLRARRLAQAERRSQLTTWVASAQELRIWDARFESTGAEREDTLRLWAECGAAPELQAHGAHAAWRAAYRPVLAEHPSEALLAPLATAEISASDLEMMSRCEFKQLALRRWKLQDLRQPEAELWRDQQGIWLHRAVELGLRARQEGGALGVREALEQAWTDVQPKGLHRNPVRKHQAFEAAVRVVNRFWEQEAEFQSRFEAGTLQEKALDDTTLEWRAGDVVIRGIPDRVLETPRGLLIQDFKSASASGLPSGTQMVRDGYRLQLPFYALAAPAAFGKAVAAVQFVSLTRAGGRGKGLFFTQHNGKVPGALTNLRANAASLLAMEPEAAWGELAGHVEQTARRTVAGVYRAQPQAETECRNCGAKPLCGIARRTLPAEDAAAAASAGEGDA